MSVYQCACARIPLISRRSPHGHRFLFLLIALLALTSRDPQTLSKKKPPDQKKLLTSVLDFLQFPNAVPLNAVARRNTQMSTNERKCKSVKERKGRFRVKIANNQV